jgi:uncharacterized integral membrane protein
MAFLWLIIGAALAVLAFAFGIQNSQAVDLFFYGLTFYGVPVWMVLAGSIVVGLLIGMFLILPAVIRGALRRRRLSRELHERDQTIGQLQQRIVQLERDVAVQIAAARTDDELPPVPDVSGETGGRSRSAA